jgi:SprT protein
MPLFRQIEFRFENRDVNVAAVGRALRLPNLKMATGAVALQLQARALLRTNGAHKIAGEVRVEWNPRLKTCAGRADYHAKLISLNPRLRDHPGEVDRTLRHELAHLLAQFRVKSRHRILPHGVEWLKACRDLGIADERRCHALPFATQTYTARFVYCCPNCREEFRRVRRVRRAVACLACCRAHNRGEFDARFRLQLCRGSL